MELGNVVKKIQPLYFLPSIERHWLAETTAKAPRDPYTQSQRICSNISGFLKCSDACQASPKNLRQRSLLQKITASSH